MQTNRIELQGRTAVVTGASRGIGLAIAAALVEDGYSVAITARRPEPLAAAVEELGGSERALGIAGDAADPEHRRRVCAAAIECFGSLDALVNNAGINPVYGPLVTTPPEQFRSILETNVIGTVGWIGAACEAWMSAHGGAIVNIASTAGLRAVAGLGAYGASKAALVQLTAQLADELGPGIRVNAISPAVVRTRFATKLYERDEEEAAARYPLRRLGRPEDVAAAAAFLLSPQAEWISGENLVVDGGLLGSGRTIEA